MPIHRKNGMRTVRVLKGLGRCWHGMCSAPRGASASKRRRAGNREVAVGGCSRGMDARYTRRVDMSSEYYFDGKS